MSEQGTQMRPLGAGEVLDAAIKLTRQNLRALAVATLVIVVPIEVISLLITIFTTDFCRRELCDAGQYLTYQDQGAYVTGRIVNVVLAVVEYVLVQLACFRILAEGYLGRSVSVGESLRFAVARSGSAFWLFVLLVLGVVLGFVCLVLPGLWLAVSWSVAVPVLLVEEVRGRKVLSRSFALVKGRWWATFGRILLSQLLIGVATLAVTAVLLAALLVAIDRATYAALIIGGIVSVLLQLLTRPFFAAVLTLIYFDLRVRKEGFDLALLAERMGGDAAVAPMGAAQPTPWKVGGGGGATDAFGNRVPAPAPAPAGGGWAPPARDAPAAPAEPLDPNRWARPGSVAPPSERFRPPAAGVEPGVADDAPARDAGATTGGESGRDAGPTTGDEQVGGFAPPRPGGPPEQ